MDTRSLLGPALFLMLLIRGNRAVITSPALDSVMCPREVLIRRYFEEGYEYQIILCFLYWVHGISLSLRQLKRLLKSMNLRRRQSMTAVGFRRINLLIRVSRVIVIERDEEMKNAVISYIQRELRESGSMLGYRALWKRLQRKYHVVVSRYVYLY